MAKVNTLPGIASTLKHQSIQDELLQLVGSDGKHFKMPTPHNLPPYAEVVSGGPARRKLLNPELDHLIEQEDIEFQNKIGTDFGNNSQLNLLSEVGDALSSCEREFPLKAEADHCRQLAVGSSSPSYSRNMNEDSLLNPSVLSILHNNMDSLNQL